jgi:hypothetical protein
MRARANNPARAPARSEAGFVTDKCPAAPVNCPWGAPVVAVGATKVPFAADEGAVPRGVVTKVELGATPSFVVTVEKTGEVAIEVL